MRRLLRFFRSSSDSQKAKAGFQQVNHRRRELAQLSDEALKAAGQQARDLPEVVAVSAAVAARVIGLVMFDVQVEGALALADGKIAEMQTGEGKTLAAVPAVAWYAKEGGGVHVMTVNDYLAQRDAKWMGPVYKFLGLSVGCIQQGMTGEERKRAYRCDITYATANEVGFDYLRDQLALHPGEQVHRPFAAAVIDEADSILIDEARIPLVIAGGKGAEDSLAYRVDAVARNFRPTEHYTLDDHGHNVALTDEGIAAVEQAFGCGNLFDDVNLLVHTAVQDSLHAHALLHRDVDYLVKDGAIESVDEFKGRIARDRRWPAGLHTAIEAKERVALKKQGSILGSITLQNLIALYPKVCGMTGTAATQSDEFKAMYGLEVEVIPTHRPVIRVDHPDIVFETKAEKEQAVIEEIQRAHSTGQPVLAGTSSVEESERLSEKLAAVPHQVLNARNDEQEAAIIARAGERGAVTISTNMAGRGTDIRLGEGVAGLGGLFVVGTNKHESRRIDNQLRGRAGRQGDPGCSRFLLSREDDLLVKHGIKSPELQHNPDSIQRLIEGLNLDIRQFLHKYEGITEGQRQTIQQLRQDVLTGQTPSSSETERLVRLTVIDELWSEHLASIAELREGVHWVSFGGRDPLHEYLTNVHAMFEELLARIEDEVATRMADGEVRGIEPAQRGATWTYLTTDQPFGSRTQRVFRGLMRKLEKRRVWA
jgi:preprotein translocase subunit SecA